MKRWRIRERAFKRISFVTTLGGVALMAVGLGAGLLWGSPALAVLLFLLGGAVALSSVRLEVVPEAGFTIALYTREACTLCDAARAFLVGKRAEYDYDVWEVDVDHDADAKARWSDWVPVAMVGDEVLFRAVPDYPRLEMRLRALADERVRR